MTSHVIFEFANIPISARAFLADALNPLLPSARKSARKIAKISILKLEGTIKKISFERLDYDR